MPYPQRAPSDVDFEGWAGVPYWTSAEAAALLVGYDPGQAGFLRDYDDDAIKMDRVLKSIERAIDVGELAGQPDRIKPYDLVCWAFNKPVHSHDLFWPVVAYQHRDERDPPTALEDIHAAEVVRLQKLNAELTRKLTSLENASAEAPEASAAGTANIADTGQPALGEKERTTFLKMILGMALRRYKYKPDARNSASELIMRDLAEVGINVSDDTIRDKLREAADKIDLDRSKSI